jgi:hypothetical protein
MTDAKAPDFSANNGADGLRQAGPSRDEDRHDWDVESESGAETLLDSIASLEIRRKADKPSRVSTGLTAVETTADEETATFKKLDVTAEEAGFESHSSPSGDDIAGFLGKMYRDTMQSVADGVGIGS